jgi:hypothetical protein
MSVTNNSCFTTTPGVLQLEIILYGEIMHMRCSNISEDVDAILSARLSLICSRKLPMVAHIRLRG